jgi:hypothetical protein
VAYTGEEVVANRRWMPSERPLVLHVLPVDMARGSQAHARELRQSLDSTAWCHRTLTIFGGAPGLL